MSDRRHIAALARAIAANAERIADKPDDWADNLSSRASLIAKDLSELQDLIRDLNACGGDR